MPISKKTMQELEATEGIVNLAISLIPLWIAIAVLIVIYAIFMHLCKRQVDMWEANHPEYRSLEDYFDMLEDRGEEPRKLNIWRRIYYFHPLNAEMWYLNKYHR